MGKILYLPWQTLDVPFALTPIGQFHQSPPSSVPGACEDVPVTSLMQLEHRETYGKAQGRIGGHQGSSVNRRYQLSFVGRFWHLRSPLATSGLSATSQCLSALPGRPGRGKFVLDGLGWKDKNQRTFVCSFQFFFWDYAIQKKGNFENEKASQCERITSPKKCQWVQPKN